MSRYNNNDDKIINFIQIDSNLQYYYIQTPYISRLDILAKKYFNDQTLYWIITRCNPDTIAGDSMFVQKQVILKIPKNIYGFINK